MHQRSTEIALPAGQSPSGASVAVRALMAELADELKPVTAPTEAVFLDLGRALSDTVGDLQRIESGFAELADQLDGHDALAAVDGIGQAVRYIAELSDGEGSEAACLGRLGETVGRLAKRLDVLRGVAGEVGVLAMNAKIQASQLTVGAADFAVFTDEMARLASLAQATIDRARGKVTGLGDAIGRARADEDAFTRRSAAELAAVRDRLGHGTAVLAERRRAAAATAQSVRERSRSEASRVAESISQLQINDITSQRIEHVRQAFEALDGVLAEEGDQAEAQALAAAVCRLQQVQLERTATDYRDQVDRLVANLRLMAADARAIVAEAAAAFSDGSGGRGSFVGQLEEDIERALALLDGFIAARGRVYAVMDAVHSGVGEIVADLQAVGSIDADMQVMGLNATLKCGRLGHHGRALGVIAHELRACGKRTEDNARGISTLLAEITEMASALHRLADTDAQGGGAALRDAMADSLARFEALGSLLDGTLLRLREDGGRVADTLDDTAGRVRIHHEVAASLHRVAERLAEPGSAAASPAEVEGIRDRLRDLLSAHYTMASERLIHQLVAEDDGPEGEGDAAPSGQDIDDCFL